MIAISDSKHNIYEVHTSPAGVPVVISLLHVFVPAKFYGVCMSWYNYAKVSIKRFLKRNLADVGMVQ